MNKNETKKQKNPAVKEMPEKHSPEWKLKAAELETELLAQVCGGTDPGSAGTATDRTPDKIRKAGQA